MCFDGRRQFVVSVPCTNCRRRQFVVRGFANPTTICGATPVAFLPYFILFGLTQTLIF